MTDLLGGRVDILFDNLPGSLPNVRAGLVKSVEDFGAQGEWPANNVRLRFQVSRKRIQAFECELKHALTIEADKISGSAREKIEKAGGSVTLRQKPPQGPRDAEQPAATAETESATEPKAKRTGKPAAKKKSPPKAAAKKKKPRKS